MLYVSTAQAKLDAAVRSLTGLRASMVMDEVTVHSG